MKHFSLALYSLIIPVLFSCKAPNPDELKKDLLPEITEAYKAGNWNKVISLTDSLRNSGVPYTDYIGDKGFDMSYCEALIATGTPEKAVNEITNHVDKINPKDYYAYHTLGVAYMSMQDTTNAIASFNKSIEIRPSYARPYLFLARLYAEKDPIQSMKNYESTIQLLADHQLYDDALSIGLEAMDIDSTNIVVLKYLGDACFGKEQLEDAKYLYKSVLKEAAQNGMTNPQIFFEAEYQTAVIEYIENNYEDVLTLLQIIYSNASGFPKTENSVLFGSYVLGAAAAHLMNQPNLSSELLSKAQEIDKEIATQHYNSFLSIKQ